MSLQKTWGNIHLTALGAMMLSFLLVGCDDSVAQNAALSLIHISEPTRH